MQEDTTERLARFASELRYEDLPERVRERCKDLLLDSLACALVGHQGEETSQIHTLAAALGQSAESTVLGGDPLSLAGATLLNGYLITAMTMCDHHRASGTHVSPVVLPPALAVAERDGSSGRDLLVAFAAGLETTTRIGIGVDYAAFRARGFHGPGVFGPFGGAAAAGSLMGLDRDRMAAAFGLAGSQAAGTFAAWGTPTVKFHQSRGALSGLMAALLAQQGFGATHQFLTASDGGLYAAYSNGGKPEAATARLGDRWELEQIALRLWPSSAAAQGIITALFGLLEKADVTPGQVRRVRIALSKPAFEQHGGFAKYNGKFEAMLSAQYAAAVIIQDREFWMDQFEPERYNDPELRRFTAEQVEVRPDPKLTGAQTLVEMETTEGRTLTSRCDVPKGAPTNPVTRSEIERKFRKCARGVLSQDAAEGVIEAVAHLENLGSVQRLMRKLRAGS